MLNRRVEETQVQRLVRMDCRVKPGNDDAGELALGDFEA
jgi:hypothetical protein